MSSENNKNKIIIYGIGLLFALTGSYNALMINSDSTITTDKVKFVKRLDETLGIIKPARSVATIPKEWVKLENKSTPRIVPVAKVEVVEAEVSVELLVPSLKEGLELNLVEVINPKKWQKGIPAHEFSGHLLAHDGAIETMNVSLPNGEGISLSYLELAENVFHYHSQGGTYSGMLYQVDQYSYIVTLTNGPLEGTRLRFMRINHEDQQLLSDNHQIEAGTFGDDQALMDESGDDTMVENIQTQAFNLDQYRAI